jgi:hypothetical protein
MAMLFGLWLAYDDEATAKAAYQAMGGWTPMPIHNREAGGEVRVSLFPPWRRQTDCQWIVSINAQEASIPAPYRFEADELSEIGSRLYNLLTSLDGYSAAQAGWEADDRVEIDELRMGWCEDVVAGKMHGLVLSEATLSQFPDASGFVPFSPGYRWIPYAGETKPNYPETS